MTTASTYIRIKRYTYIPGIFCICVLGGNVDSSVLSSYSPASLESYQPGTTGPALPLLPLFSSSQTLNIWQDFSLGSSHPHLSGLDSYRRLLTGLPLPPTLVVRFSASRQRDNLENVTPYLFSAQNPSSVFHLTQSKCQRPYKTLTYLLPHPPQLLYPLPLPGHSLCSSHASLIAVP